MKVLQTYDRQQAVLEQVHEGLGLRDNVQKRLLGSHWGRDKTAALIGNDWYFPFIRARATMWAKTCHFCQIVNHTAVPKHGMKMQPHFRPLMGWTKLGVDLVGPLDEVDGYKYICTMVDFTTKFLDDFDFSDL